MFCRKCGAPVNPGESFCSACGEKIEAAEPSQYAAQPAYQQPYVQQQQPGQPPYGQYPGGRQQYGTYGQTPKKKSKALIWAIAAVIAALAIAAVLLFVVFPAGGGANWPFTGNTTQTRFINDSFKVFSGSFSGMGNGETFKKLGREPFEISMDMTASFEGQQNKASIEAAYDNEAFGLLLEQGGGATTVLLLEDVLYTEVGGTTTGVRFDTNADMSKTMTLEQRIKSLLESYTNKAQATVNVDFGKLIETLVNSIDEACFESNGDRTTLTLDIGDIVQTLKNFTEKLESDKQLLQGLEDYIKEVSGTGVDVVSVLDMAAGVLEAQMGALKFEIVWEVAYRNGAPASLEITLDDGSSEYAVSYGYKRDGEKTDIDFSVTAAGAAAATGTISYEKTADGIQFRGDIVAGGQTLKLEGSEELKGDSVSGDVTVSVPGTGDVNVKYTESLSFGKPSESVADKFKVDTQNAQVTEASGITNPLDASGIPDPSELLP